MRPSSLASIGPVTVSIRSIRPLSLCRCRTPVGTGAEQLDLIAADADRWQIAHLIGFLSLIAICAAVLGLASIVRRRSPGLGLWAGAAAIVGILGFAFAFALDGFTWGVLGEVSGREGVDQASIATAFEEIQESAWLLPYYGLATTGFVAGMLALAWGLARDRWAKPAPAALFGLGALAVAFEGAIPSNAYFIASSALFLVGSAAVARDLLRTPDAALTSA